MFFAPMNLNRPSHPSYKSYQSHRSHLSVFRKDTYNRSDIAIECGPDRQSARIRAVRSGSRDSRKCVRVLTDADMDMDRLLRPSITDMDSMGPARPIG